MIGYGDLLRWRSADPHEVKIQVACATRVQPITHVVLSERRLRAGVCREIQAAQSGSILGCYHNAQQYAGWAPLKGPALRCTAA